MTDTRTRSTRPQYLIRAVIGRESFRECVAIDGLTGTKEVCHDILKSHLAGVPRKVIYGAVTADPDFSPCRCTASPLGDAGEIHVGNLDDLKLRETLFEARRRAAMVEKTVAELLEDDGDGLELVLVCKGCGMDTGVHAPGCPEIDQADPDDPS